MLLVAFEWNVQQPNAIVVFIQENQKLNIFNNSVKLKDGSYFILEVYYNT